MLVLRPADVVETTVMETSDGERLHSYRIDSFSSEYPQIFPLRENRYQRGFASGKGCLYRQ